MTPEESLWEAIRSLWIKYCGVSDEYRMLRDRWRYLHKNGSFHILPHLEKGTFNALNHHVKDINDVFNIKLNFKRDTMEKYDDSFTYLNKFSLKDYYTLEKKIFELSNFVGLLKLAFFQRTVSTEISHVASGLPHSPERTIGNELFYLAADKVAKSYYNCFNIPYGKWDEFITFSPPITEGHFIGAFFRPSEYTKLFHLSMSEEQKYFVGSYMFLAHEIGHAPIKKLWRDKDYFWIDLASWFKILSRRIYTDSKSILESHQCSTCIDCPLNSAFKNPDVPDVQVHQCIADILGIMVSGPNIIHALLDNIFGIFGTLTRYPPIELDLIRVITLRAYLTNAWYPKDDKLTERIDNLTERVNLSRKNRKLDVCTNLIDCLDRIGAKWASSIHTFNISFSQIFNRSLRGTDDIVLLLALCPESHAIDKNVIRKGEWSNLQEICEATATISGEELTCSKMCQSSSTNSLFSNFIIDNFNESNIELDGEKISIKDITDALSNGIPCLDVDPRYILHAYYECYKDSHGVKRPNYAATIQSLAFNTFNKKKK